MVFSIWLCKYAEICWDLPHRYYKCIIFCSGQSNSALGVLPSYLKRQRSHGVVNTSKLKKPKVIKTWDRDILCIPKGTTRSGITYPRGKYRAYLASAGLIGKLHLTSEMSDKDVEQEIRSIFRGPMQNNPVFPFSYLQCTGGGSKSLTIPSHSTSFKWTPQQVARLSSQSGTIYILAQDDLYHVDLDIDEVTIIHAWSVTPVYVGFIE